MNHRGFLASLDRDTRAALTERSDGPGLRHLAGHLGMIGVGGTWIAAGWPLWWLVLVPQGIAIIFLFTLEHECVHETPFATRWLNRVVGTLCGVLILTPFTWFRYFHLAHHKHTNDPARDPELEDAKPDSLRAYVWHVTGLPIWRSLIALLLRQAKGQVAAPYLPKSRHGRVRTEAQVHLAFYVLCAGAIALGQTWLLWCWVVPIVLGQPFLRLYLLAEHGRCPPVADMFENTRTTYTTTVVRFLAWNMPFHAEHHTYPAVPFWKLPRLNSMIRQHLRSTSDGYRDFHADYIGRLR